METLLLEKCVSSVYLPPMRTQINDFCVCVRGASVGAGAAVSQAKEAGCSHAMECQAAGWPAAKPNLRRLEGERPNTEIQLPFPQSLGSRDRDLMSSLSCLRWDDKMMDLEEWALLWADAAHQLKMKAPF